MKIFDNEIGDPNADYDIVSCICDIFDAYLINEEHGTEYLITESNNFHREILHLFEEEDKI